MERNLDKSALNRVGALIKKIDQEGREALANASKADRENAIKIATAQVDQIFRFRGRKKSPNQPLSWPRIDAYRDNGVKIEGVPKEVQTATFFIAASYLAGYEVGPKNTSHAQAILANCFAILGDTLDQNDPSLDAPSIN